MLRQKPTFDCFSNEYQALVKSAWKRFMAGKPIPAGLVPDHVLFGWKVSLENGADPFEPTVPPVLTADEVRALHAKHKNFLEAAEPILDMLRISIRDTPYLATLAVASGHVLTMVAEGALLETANDHFHLVGAHRSVENIGATALSLSMLQCRPIQLIGCEHFNIREHEWKCFSAPVFNELNEPIGSLTLSSHIASENTHTTLLARSCADCISIRIRENALMQAQKRLSAILQGVHNSLPEPILAIHTDGSITHANNKAMEHIIGGGRPIAELAIGDFFEKADAAKVQRIIRQGLPETITLMVLTHKGAQTFLCQFEPILVDGKKPSGATLTIRLEDKLIPLANRVGGNYASFTFESIKGRSQILRKQLELAQRVAQTGSRVLLFGESGTGKELFAQAIHNASPRCSGPFVAVSCAAIPRDLIESELFGYMDGAFTGAKKGGLIGKIELANGGTLFLDEINSLPFDMQSKLLRVLQQMEVMRLGGVKPTPVDVRLVCATNRKLMDAVREGTFREDLYFRINVVEISIPPLRVRGDDIGLLANLFIRRQAGKINRPAPHLTPETLSVFSKYGWPGNVRELENVCERSMMLASGNVISPEHLPQELCSQSETLAPPKEAQGNVAKVDDVYRSLILSALSTHRGNLSSAAAELGIARSTLYRRMKNLGIERY